MALDLTKACQTRDGRKVRVLCTDAPGRFPVIGLAGDAGEPSTWTLAGEFTLSGDPDMKRADLINVPEEQWVILSNQGTLFGIYCREDVAREAWGRCTQALYMGLFRLVPA